MNINLIKSIRTQHTTLHNSSIFISSPAGKITLTIFLSNSKPSRLTIFIYRRPTTKGIYFFNFSIFKIETITYIIHIFHISILIILIIIRKSIQNLIQLLNTCTTIRFFKGSMCRFIIICIIKDIKQDI